MQGNRLTELLLFAGITGTCGIVGLLTGWPVPMLLFGVLLYLGWHLYHLARLPDMIRGQRRPGPRFGTGLWADVMQTLGQQEQAHQLRQQQLSHSLEHFRKTVSVLPDAVVILLPGDTIDWSNKAARTLLGIPAGDAGGQLLSSIVKDPILDEYLNKGDFSRPLTLSAPTNRSVILQLHVRTVEADAPLRVIVAQDISRQHHLNETQRDFVANISHELRTPLTVITGLLEQLEPELANSRTGNRIGTILQKQTQRMRDLITDLLALTRIETAGDQAQDTLVPVEEMLETIIDEGRTLGRDSGHVLEAEIQPGFGLRGNASELRTAFTNLVVNAIRHTPNRAEIRVHWSADESGGRFSISDTGEGIPARHIPRLTERFYRVDDSRSRDTGGTGLGMAIVKQVLDKHDATLAITSEAGHGSTFTCRFPASRTEPLPANRAISS